MAATSLRELTIDKKAAFSSHTPHTQFEQSPQASMSSASLQQIWDASASQPFSPSIAKPQQFVVGFGLLFAALVFTGLFGLSK